ncbi:MAG: hypothetical protein PHR42_04305 [Caldisericia bacterium]|nr:hypothetical protein [Caldisericia bacterium]
MPQTWINALNQYKYPVKLSEYQYANNFHGFFKREIQGDRDSTIVFEDYFRSNVQKIEVWCEVVFWKLYSQKGRGNTNTKKCWNYWNEHKIAGRNLYEAANDFIAKEDKESFNNYRKLWPFYESRVIAVIATPISFLAPDRFPMIDTRIAKWVNSQLDKFNEKDPNGPQLIKSQYGQTKSNVLTMADFCFYLRWIRWTRYTSDKLSQRTKMKWRARDVEMAVFTAGGDKDSHSWLSLNPI